MRNLYFFFFCILTIVVYLLSGCSSATNEKVDILIIGGGASGTTAGIQASRLDCKTLIVEETTWLGGMLTSAGVSAIDGNYNLPGGLWGEFKDSLILHYGGLDSLKTGWVSNVLFEPSVGNNILKNMVSKESKLDVWYNTVLLSVERKNDRWVAQVRAGDVVKQIEAEVLIDATELGDVAKMCGVKYDIGMESSADTKESIAPQNKNNIIQDLTYVAILKDYGKDVSIPRPDSYDSTLFACACVNDLCLSPKEPDRVWGKKEMITYGKLPNDKYMINWPIEGNDYYLNIIEMSSDERVEVLKEAKDFTMCFLYFMQHELGLNTLGLADDEFPTEDRLPFIPYHRESRRIHGKVRFTLNHITKPYEQTDKLYRTAIAVGDYPVDHHHARYHGYEDLPNLYFYPIPSYGLPLGTLIPADVENLIVAEKSISVSNLVNGTTRLQPVVLQIGQASGVLGALSVKKNINVSDVKVRDVQTQLLASGGYLLPYLDVEKSSELFKIYQRIGATGILRAEGRNVGWSNQTWLRADTLLLASELEGVKEVYQSVTLDGLENILDNVVTNKAAISLIASIAKAENLSLPDDISKTAEGIFQKYQLGKLEMDEPIKRGNFAVLVDEILNPFEQKEIDIYGNIKQK